MIYVFRKRKVRKEQKDHIIISYYAFAAALL